MFLAVYFNPTSDSSWPLWFLSMAPGVYYLVPAVAVESALVSATAAGDVNTVGRAARDLATQVEMAVDDLSSMVATIHATGSRLSSLAKALDTAAN